MWWLVWERFHLSFLLVYADTLLNNLKHSFLFPVSLNTNLSVFLLSLDYFKTPSGTEVACRPLMIIFCKENGINILTLYPRNNKRKITKFRQYLFSEVWVFKTYFKILKHETDIPNILTFHPYFGFCWFNIE